MLILEMFFDLIYLKNIPVLYFILIKNAISIAFYYYQNVIEFYYHVIINLMTIDTHGRWCDFGTRKVT